ncbi:hypothetical protein OG889_44785 [Streptomyces sp. NBC_00481]|uniref:hypothetical protein n=1 Tax=Streptomyces sp. NBC_00481 TaxID=2975755 RepID=UPI002DD85196|nr:hypothetical protein [Streptomyces sp. NBC_00481]WRZ01174.1 hypothetical protein OG889_44785 [Streptomyces sp. NBC_00481]
MGQVTIEVRIDTQEPDAVCAVEAVFDAVPGATAKRWPNVRTADPVTVLAVVGNAAAVLQALLALRDAWRSRSSAPGVRAANADGSTVAVAVATDEELQRLVEPEARDEGEEEESA